MSLRLLAQRYLPISPRHLSLLTTDGEDGNPAAVVAMAAAFDPQNRIFFLEWDNPTDAASFRLTHARVPGKNSASSGSSSSITALTLVRSLDGVIHCVVQCATVKGGNKENTVANSYVYRRTVEKESDDDSDDDDNDNNMGYGSVEVRYRKLPKALEDDGRLWTAATRLYRSDGGNSCGGRVMVACGGEKGAVNALKTLRLTGTRLSVEQTLELPMLSTFPVLQLREIDGDASAVLALCHHAMLEIDPRLRPQESVVRAWKWSPHDPLTAFAVKDNAIVAGTEEGVVVAWDMRVGGSVREKSYHHAVDHSDACGAPVTGLHMPHSTTLLSCHADGSVLLWDRRTATTTAANTTANTNTTSTTTRIDGFRFTATAAAADVLPPVFAGTPGCVGLAAEDQLVVVADESGTISVFAML
ncbi:uncharacterized protein TM35_000121680 [Trypanosoma theileri]|uniref:Guanine nucleotide-binding protein subunit beta-like protein n=1 Tax=Trypanosoma theileri TaxID=67003 RepID=A0A1X0NY38_9TRYP|nr:uncharacterized protein TM35_000121680 [Trypanosoma theileri]ORC89393.1 hypothetical protein TM35_000121680 [Trypanosoma theileri]